MNMPMQRLVLLSAALFFAASGIGFITSLQDPAMVNETLNSLIPIAETLTALPDWQVFLVIFLNNAVKSLIAIALGMFFGIVPAVMLLVNGFLVGTVFFLMWERGMTLAFFAGILPHGIIEIPVFLLAAALGFKLAGAFTQIFTNRANRPSLKAEFGNALRFFARFLLPLLFVAALIEAYVTPALIGA